MVERFPTSLRYPQATIFNYQFFNTDGRNVGVYIPAINSVTSFDHGREYHCWQFNEQESIDWVE